jgi:type II secretory pathway pseudopilin PulG
MVVIMIIGILASSVLFAMYGAIEDAKIARTRTQVARIHDLVMSRWESYRTKRVRYIFPPGVSQQAQAGARRFLNSNPRHFAVVRLLLIRELMRLELPDRKTDVWDSPISIPTGFSFSGTGINVTLQPPAAAAEYQRRAPAGNWDEQYQDSECLYLILSSIRDGTSNGLDFL